MKDDRLVIGLTGSFGAGCTTTSVFLAKELRFKTFSLSSSLKKKARKEVKDFLKKGNKEIRKILQDLGDKLRKKDPAALIKPIIKTIKQKRFRRVAIECLRNPAEIEALRKAFPNFHLLAIDAEEEIRWQRLKGIYKGDKERFKRDDKRDAGDKEPAYGQRVKECIEIADMLINNEINFFKEKSKKDFVAIDQYGQKLEDCFLLMTNPGSRKPSVDELYMHHACSVALRSYCLRRQVGAVIVKEKQSTYVESDKKKFCKENYLIATGCNNVPVGELSCAIKYKSDKTKCYRRKAKKEYFDNYKYCRECGLKLEEKSLECRGCSLDNSKFPGKLLDVCRAVHAEEAAILQAARLGSVSLENTKLYSSTFPCMLCCKKVINAGVKNVIYLDSYPMQGSLAISMFRRCNVRIAKFEGVNSRAFNRLFKKVEF